MVYFTNILLPEAKRVAWLFIENKNFILNGNLNLKKFMSFFNTKTLKRNDFNHYTIAQTKNFFKNTFLLCNDVSSNETHRLNSSKWEFLCQRPS